MKTITFFLLSLLLAKVSQAGKANPLWLQSDIHVKADSSMMLTMQQFTRYFRGNLKGKNHLMSVANINFSQYWEYQPGQSVEEIKNQVLRSFPTKMHWTVRKINNGLDFDGVWKEIGRKIRMTLLIKKNGMAVITSSVRIHLSDELEKELNFFHRELARSSLTQTLVKKTSFYQYFSPISLAYAAGDSKPLPSSDTPQLPLINSLKKIDHISEEALDGIKSVGASTLELKEELSRSNNMIKGLLDRVYSVKFGDVVKKGALLSAAVGAAGAAGAAIGGWVTGMAIEGLIKGTTALFKGIFQVDARKRRWEDFKNAREAYDSTQHAWIEAMMSADKILKVFSLIEGGTMENIYAGINQVQIELEYEIDQLEHLIHENDQSGGTKKCSLEYRNSKKSLEKTLKEASSFIKWIAIHSNEKSDDDPRQFLCSMAKKLKRQLAEMSLSMDQAQRKMINGQAEWKRRLRRDYKKSKKETRRINRLATREISHFLTKSIGRQAARSAVKKLHQAKKQWLRKCRYGASKTGVKIQNMMRGKLFFRHRVRAMCRDVYKSRIEKSHYDRFVKSLSLKSKSELASYQSKLSLEQSPLKVNEEVTLQVLTNYDQWFNELRSEATCAVEFTLRGPSQRWRNSHIARRCQKKHPKLLDGLQSLEGLNKQYDRFCLNFYHDLDKAFDDAEAEKNLTLYN